MAGGIDWFRWHHGSVTDPKFQLVARKTGASLGNVIAVWAYVLEAASASAERGQFGAIDYEAVDCLLGMEEGSTEAVMAAMDVRGLVRNESVCNWEKRQPKREDETANDRKRRQREREHDAQLVAESHKVTQGHADVTQGHARGEERRVEENKELERVHAESEGPGHQPTIYGAISREIRQSGVQSNPSHPTFRALVDSGATADEFLAYVPKALAARGDRFAYLVGCVKSEREKAASLMGRLHQGALPATETDYARSMREKYEKVAPSVAARAPGVRAKPIVFDFEAEDVPARLLG